MEIITNPQQNNSKFNESIVEDDDKNIVQEVQNIVIQNTHEDQLPESLFYFLCFVLIIVFYNFYINSINAIAKILLKNLEKKEIL